MSVIHMLLVVEVRSLSCRDSDLFLRRRGGPCATPGGFQRLSNFLLWQSAYSELYFTETLFPDFSLGEFRHAVKRFGGIRRKRGKV